MKKQILSVLLTFFMILSLLPAGVLAQENEIAAWDGTSKDTSWYDSTAPAGTIFTISTAAELAGFGCKYYHPSSN